MNALALLGVGLVLLLIGSWLLTRHIHRWTAWETPKQDSWGRSFQARRCKDSSCNRHQRKDMAL